MNKPPGGRDEIRSIGFLCLEKYVAGQPGERGLAVAVTSDSAQLSSVIDPACAGDIVTGMLRVAIECGGAYAKSVQDAILANPIPE